MDVEEEVKASPVSTVFEVTAAPTVMGRQQGGS